MKKYGKIDFIEKKCPQKSPFGGAKFFPLSLQVFAQISSVPGYLRFKYNLKITNYPVSAQAPSGFLLRLAALGRGNKNPWIKT